MGVVLANFQSEGTTSAEWGFLNNQVKGLQIISFISCKTTGKMPQEPWHLLILSLARTSNASSHNKEKTMSKLLQGEVVQAFSVKVMWCTRYPFKNNGNTAIVVTISVQQVFTLNFVEYLW